MTFHSELKTGFLVIGLLLGWYVPCAAQSADNPADKTLLEIEILMPALSGNPYLAQKWRQVFEELGEGVRIRAPLPSDALKIEEVPRGPFRLVRVIGEINRDGALRLPGKTFKSTQVKELGEFLGELKTFGAQGSPTGKPLWGLNQAQFDAIHAELKTPVTRELRGMTFTEALASISLGAQTLAFHSTAEALHEAHKQERLTDEVQGLSAGTALAYVLSQEGLGFRPLRTPQGGVQLMVHPLTAAPDAWPVGQAFPDDRPRDQVVPGLFKKVQTGVNESPLSAVLEVIENESGVRILIDRRACLAKQLNPDQRLVTYPRQQTAWALIVSSIVVNSHMTMNYRQDEAGTGFLLITPFEHYQPPQSKNIPRPR